MWPKKEAWCERPGSEFWATRRGIRLVVRPSLGFARYLLLAPSRHEGGMEILLESGTAADVNAAKSSAERRAESVAWLRAQRRESCLTGRFPAVAVSRTAVAPASRPEPP